MDIEIKKIKTVKDKRGILTELIKQNDMDKKNKTFGHLFFVTFTNTHAVRGNHYHEEANEYYIVLKGRVMVLLVDVRSMKKKKIILDANKPNRLRIGPFVAHASYAISKNTLLLAYSDKPYNYVDPDTKKFIIL